MSDGQRKRDGTTITPDNEDVADAGKATESENDQPGSGANQGRADNNDVRTKIYSPLRLSSIASGASDQRTDLRTRDSHFSRHEVYHELDAAEGQKHE